MLLHATLVVGQYMILSFGATSKKPAKGFNRKSFSLTTLVRSISFAGFRQKFGHDHRDRLLEGFFVCTNCYFG